ncbi:MAG: hypothetical protein U0R19_28250 [Bryobacteraceae bacterium]
MKRLQLYFDGRCALCVWLVRWLERQRQIIPLRCILPLARRMFTVLSQNRHQAAAWLRLKTDEELAGRLREVSVPPCNL